LNRSQKFTNGTINLPVRILVNGDIEFNAEQAAIGLGICLIKEGTSYVRWERVRKYLNSPQLEKGDFITEPQFYRLAFKANNETAEKFQAWVSEEVLPTIRKTGGYQAKPLTATEQLKLATQSVIELDDRVTTLEDTMRVSGPQEKSLQDAAKLRVLKVLGGMDSNAYKQCGSKIFRQCWHDFKQYFQLPRYSELPRIKFSEGIQFLGVWLPDTQTRLEIAQHNAQGELLN
jgi:prophage antirepressor-like protein